MPKISQTESIKFEEYLNNLNNLKHLPNSKKSIKLILDGEPSRIFRDSFSLDYRREQGTFFSSHKLSYTLFRMADNYITPNAKVVDPTCGIGDLLLPFAAKLAAEKKFNEIIETWNNQIYGYDINSLLVRTTKIRLYYLSKLIDNNQNTLKYISVNKIIKNIAKRDFNDFNLNLQAKDIIIFNPPFGSMLAPEEISWGRGKIQTAAFFTINLLDKLPEGTNLFAVLPDVLRSGSRYGHWREEINKISDVLEIRMYGRFDSQTDVDVFIIHLKKKKTKNYNSIAWTPTTNSRKVEQYFNVCVGAVVPFRLKEEGKHCNYIDTKNALPWKGLKSLTTSVKFNGKSHRAPFVVVRRTSSPNDKQRIVPSLITKSGDFAVENHLFVLSPKDGTIETCKKLIENFKNPKTNRWINKYIRCRHLTKISLLELPWWLNEQ